MLGQAARIADTNKVETLNLAPCLIFSHDVNGTCRVIAGLRDRDPAVGVANEHDGLGLVMNDLARCRYIIGEGDSRILHDAYAAAIFPQNLVRVPPAGTIDESA